MALITEGVTWANGSGGGTALSAANLNNFRLTAFNLLNGLLDNDNIKAAAAIALSKLASGSSAQIIVCNGSGVPAYVAMSGDATISNTGVVTVTAAAASVTLNQAYTAGNTISVITDAITLTVTDTSNNLSMIFIQNDVTNNPGNVEFRNAGTGANVLNNQDGNGIAAYTDTESTTANVHDTEGNTVTTGFIYWVDNANAFTSGGFAKLVSGSTSSTTRILLDYQNTSAAATGTTICKLTQASTGAAYWAACTGNGTHFLMTGDPTVSSPVDGGLWFTGSALNFRNGSVTVNLISGGLAYDSGWIDISGHSSDTEYTLTHNLGIIPLKVEMYWSDSNPGTYIYPVQVNSSEDAGQGTCIRASTTQIIYGSITKIASQSHMYDLGSNNIHPAYNSGYLRVLAWM